MLKKSLLDLLHYHTLFSEPINVQQNKYTTEHTLESNDLRIFITALKIYHKVLFFKIFPKQSNL